MTPDRFEQLAAKYPCKALTDDDGNVRAIRTCTVRLAFVNFPGKKGDYRCALVFPKSADLSVLFAAADEAAKAKFGAKAETMKLHSPFKKQSKMVEQGYEGFGDDGFFVDVSTKFPPKFLSATGAEIEWGKDDIWSGMYVRAVIVPKGYDVEGKKGTNFKLNSLQHVHNGERIVGDFDPSDNYDAMEELDGATEKPVERRVSTPAASNAGPAKTPSANRWV